jgi:exodeoxyribonuclease VII large subunit
MTQEPLVLGVSDFVAIFNQTINYAYPQVTIVGELSNLRVSKGRWVYFDLKDEGASVKFFGTVYQLPGPLEDGMVLKVTGAPGLHPQFGFSITISSIQLAGEGTIKKAAKLLEAKLQKEGLFDPERKRSLPYPPETIGLITSGESAAYADFIKILQARWGDISIQLYDVLVQGQDAPQQITQAIEYFNKHAQVPDVLVITRGGGSADDLQAFSTELVTRAVAASRIPTLVAIGHEVDFSLAELAADQRASTPSNAAELLTPEKKHELQNLTQFKIDLHTITQQVIVSEGKKLRDASTSLHSMTVDKLQRAKQSLVDQTRLIKLLDPRLALKRGYALVRQNGKILKSVKSLRTTEPISIQFADGTTDLSISSNPK